jgi:hypothetical protein
MGLLDEAVEYSPKNLGSSDNFFIDADTISNADGSERYRLAGFDAAEVEKIIDGEFKQGTAGGARSTDIVSNLANKEGFTNIKPLLNPDGTFKEDVYGRKLVDLTNDKGESFNQSLLNSGAFDPNAYSSSDSIGLARIYQAQKDERLESGGSLNAFDNAAFDIESAERSEGAKALGFKKTLETEKERAQYIDYFESKGMSREEATYEMDKYFNYGVERRRSDVDLNFNSLNPFTDSWEQGWTSVGEAAYGVAEMFGSKTGNEGLESWGQEGIEKQRSKLSNYGNIINSYKDINSVGSAFEYLGSTMAMSLPYMAATAAATVAAPATYGASFSVPVAIFAGMTWNEMEGDNDSKSASLAIGAGVVMTVLDRIGIKGLGGFAAKNPAKTLQEAANKLAKERAISQLEAGEIVQLATNTAIAEFAEEAEKIAKQQLLGKATAKRIAQRIGTGSVAEGLTEVGQETVGYLAAVQGSDKIFDYQEFQERLANAAVAGSALGATFSVPGTVKDQLSWMDAAARFGEPASPSEIEEYARIEILNNRNKPEYEGKVRTVSQVLSDVDSEMNADSAYTALADRATMHKNSNKEKSFLDRASTSVMNVSNLWQASVTNAIPKSVLDKSSSARALASILGGTLTPLHGGSGMEAAQHHLVTAYKNQVSDPKRFYKEFGLKSVFGVFKSSDKARISDEIYSVIRGGKKGRYQKGKFIADPEGKAREFLTKGEFDPKKVPAGLPNRTLIVNLGTQLKELSNIMRDDQVAAGAKMGDLSNYLGRYKALNKTEIYKNQAEFKKLLMTKLGKQNMSAAEAQRITDEIIDNPLVNDLGDALASNVGSLNPSSHKKRTLNLSENTDFDKFFERDIFANVATAAKAAARYSVQMQYVGKDGSKIAHLLKKMEKEGVSKEEVNRVASDVSDILEAMSGNYNRPKTQAGKKLMRFQKNVMFWMTLSALPLATFSSLPEMAMTQSALTNDQIFGKNGSIKSFTSEFAASFIPQFKKVENNTDEDILKVVTRSKGQEKMSEVGMYQWEVGAATTTGVSEIHDGRRNTMELFFKAIGLTQWTDYTRAIRAAMAYDFIKINSEIVAMRNLGYTKATREAQEAEQKLRSLGIPVEQFAEMMYQVDLYGPDALNNDPKKIQMWETTMKEATFNFINQAIPLPGAANRPLIYQDPRFALFTQFQGFISTFTANQIPRMWNDYIKRGTPTMRYNTFVLMSTMIAMGFLTQAMKDAIKFEDDDDEGTLGNPYLDTPEYIRRGVMSSGLLGTSERIVDLFAPIYGQRSSGMGDWIYNQAAGESPTLGYVGRLGDAALNVAKGDFEKAIYQGLKSAPGVAPFTDTNKSIASFVTGGGWNYKDNEEN